MYCILYAYTYMLCGSLRFVIAFVLSNRFLTFYLKLCTDKMADEFVEFLLDNPNRAQGAKFRKTNGQIKFREGVSEDLKNCGYEDSELELGNDEQRLFADIDEHIWDVIHDGFAEGQKQWLKQRNLVQTKERWDICVDRDLHELGYLPLTLSYGGCDTEFSLDPDSYSEKVYIGKFSSREAWEWRGPWWYVLELLHDRSFDYEVAVLEEVRDEDDELAEYNVYGLRLDD